MHSPSSKPVAVSLQPPKSLLFGVSGLSQTAPSFFGGGRQRVGMLWKPKRRRALGERCWLAVGP